MKAPVALLVAVCSILAAFSGCNTTTQGKTFRYDIAGPVENLDPQFASDATARMIIGNLYEGLVVQEADGEIVPGAASSYEVSSDGLRYSFTLRDGVCWEDGAPLTSDDFRFSFERMLSARSPSPYAADYISIDNAAAVLTGSKAVSELGIQTPDDSTIIFTLSEEDPFFLELLAATPASPCNRSFFTEARGRYGLEPTLLYTNGPFTMERWDNTKYLLLKKSTVYVSEKPVIAGQVAFYVAREDAIAQFLDGKADVVTVPSEEMGRIADRYQNLQSFDKTVWCIVFNQRDAVVGNPLIRQSLAHAADRATMEGYLPDHFTTTEVFIPPAMQLLDESYRDLAGSQPVLPFNTQRASALKEMAFDMMEVRTVPQLTLLVPETDGHQTYMMQLQSAWFQHLGINVEIVPVSTSSVEDRLRSGNYQMLLMPFSPSSGRIDSLLSAFSSTSTQNYTGYNSPFYDSLYSTATGLHTVDETARAYYRAEHQLLLDVAVLPVYFETTTYVIGEGVTGLEVSPFAGRLNFKYAEK